RHRNTLCRQHPPLLSRRLLARRRNRPRSNRRMPLPTPFPEPDRREPVMKASTALASLLFVAALTGCARREATDDAATADANAETPAESAPPANAPPAAPPPSPEIAPVTVAITLSPAAEAQMKATSESIA